ncbi:glycosyl hydrolase family 95 catalytic domain-containing protein [Neotamlana sedimentorum]|uniref:glycosyl hydrolase family 95 catalytic domain-containing protein n=1 Tax=Neotamlana sedimentorum TaxID=1435349 RepID=UPI00103D41D8|nr:hypothetical protein [Tamlana sedimentorum]
MLWINRGRLPLGRFDLQSKGQIQSVDLRLDLWNAQLTGWVYTTTGSYFIKGYTHSNLDVIYFETEAKDGESIKITWIADKPIPPVWETLQTGKGPKGSGWDKMRNAPMPMPDSATFSEDKGVNFCYQPLYQHRGETTTAWKIIGSASGKQQLIASVHHSYPEKNSLTVVKNTINQAEQLLQNNTLFTSHQKWWHQYYPLSFITFNDIEKESFYWIQMYKLASATRGNGPIMDLMGPWYHKTFWPMVWGDLNVELQYWTHLTANRMAVGESLPNSIDKYKLNLENNVTSKWKESINLATLFPQDFDAYNGAVVPDMLVWILHNYWLHCKFEDDDERIRIKLFPLLKKAVNSYLNYIKDNPVDATDGKIHIKNSWSPEYPGGRGQDINFTIALIKWSTSTLLSIDDKYHVNDPLKKEWQNLYDNLVGFQIDDNGLRIGKDIPFNTPHRHYSHLLGFYPLSVLSLETEYNKKLLRTTLDHWLNVSINSDIKVNAMPVTGYTATGAASMYAMLNDADKAYYYLNFFISHKNVSPTTMYAEGNPVIESPLSFATCIHDMFLQSWDGKINVFPAIPTLWPDASFYHLRTQGAFLVSAKKIAGITEFIEIESLHENIAKVKTDIQQPYFYSKRKLVSYKKQSDGFYYIPLKKSEKILITSKLLNKTDLSIKELNRNTQEKNLFGYSDKTERLPSDAFYTKK